MVLSEGRRSCRPIAVWCRPASAPPDRRHHQPSGSLVVRAEILPASCRRSPRCSGAAALQRLPSAFKLVRFGRRRYCRWAGGARGRWLRPGVHCLGRVGLQPRAAEFLLRSRRRKSVLIIACRVGSAWRRMSIMVGVGRGACAGVLLKKRHLAPVWSSGVLRCPSRRLPMCLAASWIRRIGFALLNLW